jgi:hypothetical protein
MDGSTDGGLDGGDAAPDADAGPPEFETECTGGVDEDGDGRIDCADFDCADSPACCSGGGNGPDILDADWENISGGWGPVPSGVSYPATQEVEDGTWRITDFGEGNPKGVVRDGCTPMALGLHGDVTLHTRASGSDSDFAAMVLTRVDDVEPGNRLADELAVTLTGAGRLYVSRARALCEPGSEGDACRQERILAELEREERPGIGGRVELTLEVTPGIGQQGNAALFATLHVRVFGAGGKIAERDLITRRQFIRQEQLEAECDTLQGGDVPGLNVAFEGRGSRVQVGEPTASPSQCGNPNYFDSTPAQLSTIEQQDLHFGESWSSGGFDSFAAATFCGGSECWRPGGDIRWHLVSATTNVDMGAPPPIFYSLGHGRSLRQWGEDGWTDPNPSPWAGADPPTCLDGGSECDGNRSVREPSLQAPIRADGTLESELDVAYAVEWQTAIDQGNRNVFALNVTNMKSDPAIEDPVDLTEVDLEPDEVGCDEDGNDCCESLRDPELLPAQPRTRQNSYWLLFTCMRSQQPPGIWAVKLDDILERDPEVDPAPVLQARDLGGYAAGGVRGAEALVAFDPNGETPPVVRVWFEARDESQNVSIGLSTGQLAKDAPSLTKRLPELAEYGANPVLGGDGQPLGEAPALGVCPGRSCEFLDFDVMLKAAQRVSPGLSVPRDLRVLVGRRVVEDGSWSHQYIPLDQSWRPQ